MPGAVKCKEFLGDVAGVADGDYATGFKLLGFVLYVSQYGVDDLVSGAMISPRTYYRWVDMVKAAGWESVLADVRFRQAVREYVSGFEGESSNAREAVLVKVNEFLSREGLDGKSCTQA